MPFVPPRRPMPDDFATVALDKGTNWLITHYNTSAMMIQRWLASMPADWTERRRANIKAQFDERIQRQRAAGEARRAEKEAARAAQGGRVHPRYRLRPAPEGFYEMAATTGVTALRDHFRMSFKIASRLIADMPQEWRDTREAAVKADKVSKMLASRKVLAAARPPKPPKPVKERKPRAVPKARAATQKPAPFKPKPVQRVELSGGRAAMAARFLQTRIRNVFDAGKVHGRAELKGMFSVGGRLMPEAAMIEHALKLGWQPDAWKTIPAASAAAPATRADAR